MTIKRGDRVVFGGHDAFVIWVGGVGGGRVRIAWDDPYGTATVDQSEVTLVEAASVEDSPAYLEVQFEPGDRFVFYDRETNMVVLRRGADGRWWSSDMGENHGPFYDRDFVWDSTLERLGYDAEQWAFGRGEILADLIEEAFGS